MVRQMSKKSYFRTHFDTLNVKGCQTVLILCTTAVLPYFSLLPKKFGWKLSLLVISGILGLFVDTLTADEKYSPRNSESLPQPILK